MNVEFVRRPNHHGAMSEIFISYARADKAKAELLADAFSNRGWSVWWDREIPPGQAFDETIENALNSARCVIVLWSRHSVASRWVKIEAAEGAGRGILVPVLIENVKIPLEFKRIEAADLSHWNGDASDRELDQLLRTVASLIGGKTAIQHQKIPIEVRAAPPRRWSLTSVSAGTVLGVILSLAALHQAGFLDRQKAGSKHQAETVPRKNPGENAAKSQVTSSPPASGQSSRAHESGKTNLLSSENGGHVVAATNDAWRYAVDGDERNWHYIDIGVTGSWAVYGFKDGNTANFDRFKVFIGGAESWNLNEFELLAGNDAPTGRFEPIGRFKTQNVRFQDPYQEFTFQPVKAKFLKVRVISSHGFSSVGVHEFQLLGALEDR